VWTSAVVAVLLAIRAYRAESVPRGVLLAGGLIISVVAAEFTGYLLPWDQLALWQVTVGTNMMGYRIVWGDQVRFALLGGTEVAIATLRKWLILHVALGLTTIGLTALGWRRSRRPDPDPVADGSDEWAIDVPVGV
jgi:quinol-cytochrome oxidoreductase complex cytochrome b subunit